MKIAINTCFGGFSLSEKAASILNVNPYDNINRTNPQLIAMVELDAKATGGMFAELEVVEIPDDATDYLIDEYDGCETIYYVLNGKIHRTY